jgi:hypothetical protein
MESTTDEKKEIVQDIKDIQNKNVLENGTYSIYGPDNGEITFDVLELHAGSGAVRKWKVEEFGRDKIVFKVLKFG